MNGEEVGLRAVLAVSGQQRRLNNRLHQTCGDDRIRALFLCVSVSPRPLDWEPGAQLRKESLLSLSIEITLQFAFADGEGGGR